MQPSVFVILLLAGAGFWISIHIRRMRGKKVPMTCPIGTHCEDVLNSKYNSMFGVSNELAGMAYYVSVIGLAFLLLLGITTVVGAPIGTVLLLFGGAALFFSLVLTGIQAFILHEWCSWCIASALMNVAIFFLEWKLFV